MTSRSTLGGYEQSTGSLHRGSTHDYLPQFQTWSSIDRELAPSRFPQAAKVLPSVARSAQQEDRALFPAIRSALKPAQLREALLNVVFVGGAVGAICIMATIVLLVPYWVLFVRAP